MKPTWKIFCIICSFLSLGLFQPGAFAEIITHTQPDAITDIWRINEPPVNAPQKDYPEIIFRKGDIVRVQAGGCVQTGGPGKTWKDYVNPRGDNSDRLYYGLIWLRGDQAKTPGLVPIKNVIDTDVDITAVPEHDASQMYLTLGYKDDTYSDNGYYEHDDGTEEQCKEKENAFVLLTITHTIPPGPAEPPKPPTAVKPGAPMDLWWNEVDDNALPLNPMWGHQYSAGGVPNGLIPDAGTLCDHFREEGQNALRLGSPPCTTQQPLVDEPNGLSDPITYTVCQAFDHAFDGTVHGHINWGYATYTGKIYFQDFQNPARTEDNDYDLVLVRERAEGVTSGNQFRYQNAGQPGLTLEFDSKETVDNFISPWWRTLKKAVDDDAHDFIGAQDWVRAQALIDGKDAIVVGLIGLDNNHTPHTEIHPVHALAINVADDPCYDNWALFVRNWGNEGGCSQQQHYLPLNTVSLFFPGYTELDPSKTQLFGDPAVTGWGARVYSDGILLSVKLPDPGANKKIVHGEIYLKKQNCSDQAASVKTEKAAIPYNKETAKLMKLLGVNRTRVDEGDITPIINLLSKKQQTIYYNEHNQLEVLREGLEKNIFVAESIKSTDDLVPEARKAGRLPELEERRLPYKMLSAFDTELAFERQLVYDAFTEAAGGRAQALQLLRSFAGRAAKGSYLHIKDNEDIKSDEVK